VPSNSRAPEQTEAPKIDFGSMTKQELTDLMQQGLRVEYRIGSAGAPMIALVAQNELVYSAKIPQVSRNRNLRTDEEDELVAQARDDLLKNVVTAAQNLGVTYYFDQKPQPGKPGTFRVEIKDLSNGLLHSFVTP
jgi:hypothetical protein